jgi:hypothetical protein
MGLWSSDYIYVISIGQNLYWFIKDSAFCLDAWVSDYFLQSNIK